MPESPAAQPDWLESFPQIRVSRLQRRRVAVADCTPLDVDFIASFFEPGGVFSRLMPGYESRPGQVQMARAVAEAFNEGSHLLVEAGTGVGKSLGYLLPAACWALRNDIPVVVSTNTRNLQSQLVDKDLPTVRAALDLQNGGEKSPLRVALLKGRTNYLCLRRLATWMEEGFFGESEEQEALEKLLAWAKQSEEGDLDDFVVRCKGIPPGFLRSCASSGEECGGRSCRFYRRCFVQRARIVASRAHVVVANHALVFADLANPGSILPQHGQIVFDEAHNLEEAATRHFSLEVKASDFSSTLSRMARGRAKASSGTLESARRNVLRGPAAQDPDLAEAFNAKFAAARASIEQIRKKAKPFFALLNNLLPPTINSARFRCVERRDLEAVALTPCGTPVYAVERQVVRNRLFAAAGAAWNEEKARLAKDALSFALGAAVRDLTDLAQAVEATQSAGELSLYGDIVASISGCAEELKRLHFALEFVFAGTDAEHVFWAERVRGRGRREKDQMEIFAAPLDVGGKLADALYSKRDSVIFSSATLRVGASFGFSGRRLGLGLIAPEKVKTCIAESPFNYMKQCLVLAPSFLPSPDEAEGTPYCEQLATMMAELFAVTQGRALALFTSYEMMRAVTALVEPALSDQGLKLLVHGRDGSRERILQQFRSSSHQVLFGVHSFWEGVDVVGEALSCVVLCRLPFAAVGDPVVEARCEKIDLEGRSAFREFSLPSAVIRFRQGFGRLIRSQSDRGVVIVADPRILHTGYGAVFRKALPSSILPVGSSAELAQRTRDFVS